MPSPAGHALGGLILGWLVDGRGAESKAGNTRAFLLASTTLTFAFLGALADIDFAFGAHSGPTHSVGAAFIVFVVAASCRAGLRRSIACAAAYGSHALLDWMGNDTTPPIGIMALWPFTTGYYQSELFVFEAISRRYWLPNFWSHNLLAVAREIAILAPMTIVAWWVSHGRCRRSRSGSGAGMA